LTFTSGIYWYVSLTRLSLRPSRGPILIAALIALAALLPAAAVGGTKSNHLEFRLSALPHQDMVGESAIEVRVRCLSEPCTVVGSAKSKDPSLHTGQGRLTLEAGEADTLVLPLSKQQRGKLKAALEAGRSPLFTVKATAHDQGGTHIPLSIQVEAKKP
jgi:hypothetical protein